MTGIGRRRFGWTRHPKLPRSWRRCTKLRDEVLVALSTPILFVQGTRDSLCPLDLLEKVRARMSAKSYLHVVEAGDHSLLVSKTQLKASQAIQDDVDREIQKAIGDFAHRVTGGD